MRTQGTAIRNKIDDSIGEIRRLEQISYLEEDYSKLFKIIGGEVEKFLKSTIFQSTANKNFYTLIDDLISIGISQNSVDALHTFRETYNGYKHQPGFTKSIVEAKQIFEKASSSIEEIIASGVGNVHHHYMQKSKRLVWFAGWDDYIGGMVECNIFIPDNTADFPTAVEHFNASFDGLDAVIKQFTMSGDLKMGKEYVSDKAYKSWAANSDLMGVGSFSGDVAEFVRELARHNSSREKDLIPFLKRENDSMSVKAALVFSMFDSLRQNSWTNNADFKDELILRATYDYGINIESQYLDSFLNKIDYSLIGEKRNILKNTDDIRWTDEIGYQSKEAILSSELHIAIDKEDKMLVRVK